MEITMLQILAAILGLPLDTRVHTIADHIWTQVNKELKENPNSLEGSMLVEVYVDDSPSHPFSPKEYENLIEYCNLPKTKIQLIETAMERRRTIEHQWRGATARSFANAAIKTLTEMKEQI